MSSDDADGPKAHDPVSRQHDHAGCRWRQNEPEVVFEIEIVEGEEADHLDRQQAKAILDILSSLQDRQSPGRSDPRRRSTTDTPIVRSGPVSTPQNQRR